MRGDERIKKKRGGNNEDRKIRKTRVGLKRENLTSLNEEQTAMRRSREGRWKKSEMVRYGGAQAQTCGKG